MPAAPPRAISATAMPTYKDVFDFLNRDLMKGCDEIGTPEVRYLAFSYQLSAISYQVSAISYQSAESRELKISVHVDSAEFRNDVPPPGGRGQDRRPRAASRFHPRRRARFPPALPDYGGRRYPRSRRPLEHERDLRQRQTNSEGDRRRRRSAPRRTRRDESGPGLKLCSARLSAERSQEAFSRAVARGLSRALPRGTD